MSHQLYNAMEPIGQMHARELARAVDAMCQQACTHAAMAGAMVAQGMTPSQAFHAVMAMEGAGTTVAPEMQVVPAPLTQSLMSAARPGVGAMMHGAPTAGVGAMMHGAPSAGAAMYGVPGAGAARYGATMPMTGISPYAGGWANIMA